MLVSKGVEEDGISGDVEGLRKARFVGGVGSSSWSISSIPSTLSGAISLFGSMFKLSVWDNAVREKDEERGRRSVGTTFRCWR